MSFPLLIKTAPASAIPKANTKAYRLLALLANGKPVPEIHILIELGGNCRSQLQALKNDKYGHWNIIPQFDDKGIIVSRRLDPRHLSGNTRLDARARAERRVELKTESLTLSIHEKARTSKARAELSEAEDHLLDLESGNN